MPDALAILRRLALGHIENDRWAGAPLEFIKGLSPTAVGAVGEGFVHEMCIETGLSGEFPMSPAGRRWRGLPWDIGIEGRTFEVKTATQGARGTFQFNNIQTRRPYDALLVIAITPTDVFTRAWTRSDVMGEGAGRLVPMARDTPALRKLTGRVGACCRLTGSRRPCAPSSRSSAWARRAAPARSRPPGIRGRHPDGLPPRATWAGGDDAAPPGRA